MRSIIAAWTLLVFAAVPSIYAQSKVVTNADLEVYRQRRLKAERDYRDNYEKLGLPSPEELDRRREQSRIETEQLSAKLRAARLEREYLDMQRETYERLAAAYQAQNQSARQSQYYGEPYYWSYGTYGTYGAYATPYRDRGRQPFYQQPGYFAGGQFWPTGPRTPPRPMIIYRNPKNR